jgi:hypothetical protein
MRNIITLIVVLFILTGCSEVKQNIIKPTPVITKPKIIIVPKIEKIDIIELVDLAKEEKKSYTNLSIIFSSQNIGKYALEATNSISTYLLHQDKMFDLKVYDLVVQNKQNLQNVILKVQKENITKVIAMITKEELTTLNDIPNISDITFYFPLINKYDVENIKELKNLNFTFGAISYKKQFEELIKYTGRNNLVEFYGNSGIGRTLHSYLKNEKIKFSKKVDDNNGRYKSFLEDNTRLNNSVVLLNTPIIKSSILLSAINAQELTISSILSTQLNYTPLLFSLTQKRDRKKLIIANSIGSIPSELDEYNKLIGNNLSYSWVNYSTIIGVEYLMNGNIDIYKDLSLIDNQIEYPVKLYKVGNNSFKQIK